MPTMRKLNITEVKTPKVKGKRGRPAGSTNKEKIYIFGATCGKGCPNGESGIRNAQFECKHGAPFEYIKMVIK